VVGEPRYVLGATNWGEGLFAAFQRVAYEPDGGGPQTYEQGSALGVPSFFLIDGLAPDPQGDAQAHRPKGQDMQMPSSKPAVVHPLTQHRG
jgi:hypothetical protein